MVSRTGERSQEEGSVETGGSGTELQMRSDPGSLTVAVLLVVAKSLQVEIRGLQVRFGHDYKMRLGAFFDLRHVATFLVQ